VLAISCLAYLKPTGNAQGVATIKAKAQAKPSVAIVGDLFASSRFHVRRWGGRSRCGLGLRSA
jgi:hypothetical protein